MSAGLSRRSFLGAAGALAGTALLPRSAWADASAPKRLIVIFSPNGTVTPSWTPTGQGASFTLSPILKPFEPFKSRMLVLDGITAEVAKRGDGDDHMRGIGSMLTGVELLPGTVQGGGGTPAGLGGGISVDQRIASVVGMTTPYKSLEFGAYVKQSDVWSRMAYAGPNQPLPPMEDPLQVYKRLYASDGLSGADLARLLRRRKSVLDHVKGSLGGLKGRIGSADAARVQAHLESVRQIEQQLVSQSAGCVPPMLGQGLDLSDINNYPQVGRLQLDLLAAALACDLTRVATMQFTRANSDIPMPWLGFSDGHHSLSHMGDSDAVAQDKLVKINLFYASQIAYFLAKLDAVQENNGGTLLDNSLVVWMNELSRGNIHGHDSVPLAMFGGARGAIKMGRYVKLSQPQFQQNLLVSIANAMDVPLTTFGDPAYCSGALVGL